MFTFIIGIFAIMLMFVNMKRILHMKSFVLELHSSELEWNYCVPPFISYMGFPLHF